MILVWGTMGHFGVQVRHNVGHLAALGKSPKTCPPQVVWKPKCPTVGYNGKCEIVLINSLKAATVLNYNKNTANIKCPIYALNIFDKFGAFGRNNNFRFSKKSYVCPNLFASKLANTFRF